MWTTAGIIIQRRPPVPSHKLKRIGKARELFRRQGGVLRTRDALRLGIHPRTLYEMREEGNLEQLSRAVSSQQPAKAREPGPCFHLPENPTGSDLPRFSSGLSQSNNSSPSPSVRGAASRRGTSKSTLSPGPGVLVCRIGV